MMEGKSKNYRLKVFCFNLEIALWVVANGANLGSLFPNDDVATVGALPYAFTFSGEDDAVLDVLE